jgi:hypothetical protein
MAMREITEDEPLEMAGDSDCPVLAKEESDEMEAAVCLKRFPQGYVLGVSDKIQDLSLWFTSDKALADQHYARFVARMRRFGTPFGGQDRDATA